MKFKPLMLASAAVIALSGMALSSAPVAAADPEERAVTRGLNAQQLDTPSIVTRGARPGEMSARPASLRTVQLDEIDNPEARLMHRMVETRFGEPVGQVRTVLLDDEGNIDQIDVSLRDGRMVSIDADMLAFDESGDVLITDMSRAEINNLPEL